MVQKKKGRPRKFDRDAALEAAMLVFWEKGYDAASLDDLTAAMSINRPSLYGTYGDKAALFREAMRAYGDTYGKSAIEAFLGGTTPHQAVEGFLKTLITNNTQEAPSPRGCMMANCGPTVCETMEDVATELQNGLAETEQLICGRFDAFRQQGFLPEDFPSVARATMLADMMYGLAFRARTGTCRQDMLYQLSDRVGAILN
ncbi:MAG: TetR/AcrR family transcriptional regulator [Pseudomonadota bacterium]